MFVLDSDNKVTQNVPSVLIIRVLEACNAGCFMCDFANSKDFYRFTSDDARKLCEKPFTQKYKLVRLTGGEPLLLKDISDIVYCFKSYGLLTSIITNGWFLVDKYESLVKVGLDQVIVSCDGASAQTHDSFRRTSGLFKRLIQGICLLKQAAPQITIRVNTVAGVHNVQELVSLYRLLASVEVDQWSIIPLKSDSGTAQIKNLQRFRKHYSHFQNVISKEKGPELLGYSRQWAGRNEEEEKALYKGIKAMTPRTKCDLVNHVRYFIPKEKRVFPCNCVSHRKHSILLNSTELTSAFESSGLNEARNWLSRYGPTYCTGCEPINAALGEGAINLETNPMGF